MGQAIYAFVFSAIMSINATNVIWNNLALGVIDWIAFAWLFYAGCVATFDHYKDK